jgi:hypothetical protein
MGDKYKTTAYLGLSFNTVLIVLSGFTKSQSYYSFIFAELME